LDLTGGPMIATTVLGQRTTTASRIRPLGTLHCTSPSRRRVSVAPTRRTAPRRSRIWTMASRGIYANAGSTVSGKTAYGNANAGIQVNNGSTASDNTTCRNGGNGIETGSGADVTGNQERQRSRARQRARPGVDLGARDRDEVHRSGQPLAERPRRIVQQRPSRGLLEPLYSIVEKRDAKEIRARLDEAYRVQLRFSDGPRSRWARRPGRSYLASMARKGLVAWQWSLYREGHRDRGNLLLHIVAVPLFWLGLLALGSGAIGGRAAWTASGLVAMAVSLGLQGRGHRRERVEPVAFEGPWDAISRLLLEQLWTFPRFVLSGGFARALRFEKATDPDSP
jgi:hypothetical protein